jgi:UDP-N-acetyl-D-mannosaminuronate dehydrogenase
MTITVVGLGKIGLPLAVQYASLGHRVIGADINPSVVADVNAGVEPFPGEFDLAPRLRALVDAGALSATTSTAEAVSASDAVVVVVPVAIDAAGTPDFRHMDGAVADIGGSVRPGTVVSFETTVPMGTTRSPVRAGHRGGVRADGGRRRLRRLQPRARAHRPRLRRPAQSTPSSSAR